MREVALRNKKLSRNERELNPNGTVGNVVSYQCLCTLYTKFPKTGCNIFNNCSLRTAIFLIFQHAHLARLIILPLIFSLLTKRTASVFPRQLLETLSIDDGNGDVRNSNVTLRMSGGKYLDVLLRGPT